MILARSYVVFLAIGISVLASATGVSAQSVAWKTNPTEKQAGTLYCDGVVTCAAGLDQVTVTVFGVSKTIPSRVYRVEATVAPPGPAKDGMTTYAFSATIVKSVFVLTDKLPNGQYDVYAVALLKLGATTAPPIAPPLVSGTVAQGAGANDAWALVLGILTPQYAADNIRGSGSYKITDPNTHKLNGGPDVFTFPIGGGTVRQNAVIFTAPENLGARGFSIEAAHPKGEYQAVVIANFSPKTSNAIQIISSGFTKITIR